MDELNKMLNNHLRKAMNLAMDKMEADTFDTVGKFYTKGKPKSYKRTGALGNTPMATNLTVGSNMMSFTVYLNTAYTYTTGDNPTMSQVLQLANYGKKWTTKGGSLARDTLGKKGFWENAENKMEKSFYRVMRSFFK